MGADDPFEKRQAKPRGGRALRSYVMEQAPPDSSWLHVLEALPISVALLDADGVYRYLNETSAADPVLARGRPGHVDLDCCAHDPGLLERVRRRRAHCAEAIRTNAPCLFEERTDAPGAEGRSVLWLCTPLPGEAGPPREVALLGLDLTAWERSVEVRARRALAEQIADEVQVPLISVVSLVASLARELDGEPGARAALIDRNGQYVLRRLHALLAGGGEPRPFEAAPALVHDERPAG